MKKLVCFVVMFSLLIVTYGQLADVKDTFHSRNGKIKMITFNTEGNLPRTSESHSLMKSYFNLSENDKLILKSTNIDDSGITHQRFEQYYSGIKVENAEIIVHSKNGNILSINGEAGVIKDIDLSPEITSEKSIEIAKENLHAKEYAWESLKMESFIKDIKKDENATFSPKPELVLWNKSDGTGYVLAYKLDIVTSEPTGVYIASIDANTGKILYIKNIESDATAVTRYTGTVNINTVGVYPGNEYQLQDINTLGGGHFIETRDCNTSVPASSVPFEDLNDVWDEWHNAEMDDAALDAHYGGMFTYNYFKNVHNRNSYDGSNSNIYIYVHCYLFSGLDNAAWDPILKIIKCGDGTGNNNPFTSEEVIAHEFGHGLTNSFCDLSGTTDETGAIKEGLSDIWGICVEDYVNYPGNQVWVKLEDSEADVAYRPNYADPNASYYQISIPYGDGTYVFPDTYEGTGWYDVEGDWDDGGVHVNSMVLSHWFHILSTGGVDENDNGLEYIVSPIGIVTASNIVYKLYNYITTSIDFSSAAYYLKNIAVNDYGVNSNIAIQTTNAWYAVGIGTEVPNLISGDAAICSLGAYRTYSLPSEFAGETITWNTNGNLQITSGQGTRQITVQTLSNGLGTITATYNHGNGNIVCTKNVVIGIFSNTVVTGQAAVCPNSIYTYTAQVPGGHSSSYSYSWTYPSNWYKYSKYQNTITLQTPSSPYYGQVRVSITNACGTSGYSGITVYPKYYGCGGYYSMYSNPASDEVTITINETASNVTEDTDISDVITIAKDISDDPTIYTIRIYNSLGTLISTATRSGTSFNIPLTNMRDGTYIVEVSDGKNSFREQLIVKHD